MGRFSANEILQAHPDLLAKGDPQETLMRLKVLRATLFDFPAFDLPMLTHGAAKVSVDYQMGPVAEEAACHQTMGFCEGLLSLSGAENVRGTLEERAWEGAPTTIILLEWISVE